MSIHQIIKDLFIIRSDTYGKQMSNGSYVRMEEELNNEVIQKHLDGEITVGAYQFNNDKCKWICFDFDGKDLHEEFNKAKILFLKLRDDCHIKNVLLEFSGKKGYHVWVFCEEVDGISAQVWAQEISEGYGVHEIFPKQTNAKDKYGSLVKIPLCVHRVSGNRSVLYDERLNELTHEESLILLEHIHNEEKLKIPRVIVKEIIRTIKIQGAKTELPSIVMDTIKNGVAEGERHKYRFIITKEMYNAGYNTEEIVDAVGVFNKNCSPPENELITERHVRRLLEYPERYLAKEITHDLITAVELEELGEITYDTVLKTYKKWFYMTNEMPIDTALAVAITRKEQLSPLWIIFIAPSGSGKSEVIKPLEDKNRPSTTEIMAKITRNTFLSGVKDEPDFATTLKNNPKLFITPDFAQFIKLGGEEKAQIWAQLRDLYDGFIERKAAFNVNKKVTDIKVNWLICSTPIVDSEILIHQELGTRELLFRFDNTDIKENELMNTVWLNSELLKQMRSELSFVVRKFIEKKETEGLKQIYISEEVKQELMNIAVMISYLRAATESDAYTGELTNFVYREMPTRILLQLKALFIGLKNLDENYSDQKALKVIQRVALSSIHPIRLRILLQLLKNNELSTTAIQKKLAVGWKTVITQLYSSFQLGLVDYSEDSYDQEEEHRQWKKKTWKLSNHPVINYLREKESIKLEVEHLY